MVAEPLPLAVLLREDPMGFLLLHVQGCNRMVALHRGRSLLYQRKSLLMAILSRRLMARHG